MQYPKVNAGIGATGSAGTPVPYTEPGSGSVQPIHQQLTNAEKCIESINVRVDELATRLGFVLAEELSAQGGKDANIQPLLATSPVGRRLCYIVDRLNATDAHLSVLLERLEI